MGSQAPIKQRFLSTDFCLRLIFCLLVAGLITANSISSETSSKSVFSSSPPPIEPQKIQDRDSITWAGYQAFSYPIWAEPSLKPERGFKLAIEVVDLHNHPFIMTRLKGSGPFDNPQIDPTGGLAFINITRLIGRSYRQIEAIKPS